MSIVSRRISDLQHNRNGTVFAAFLAVDDKGREWRRSRARFADEAEAQAAEAAHDWTPQLKDKEEADATEFIEDGGNPNSFPRSDLTQTQFRRRIIRRFMRGDLRDQRRFLCRVANWVSGFNTLQIANSLGISVPRANNILTRATDLRDNVCPALTADDGRVDNG